MPQAAVASGEQAYRADDLLVFVAALFRGAGLPSADAECVARSLVRASLRGQDTHGVGRVPAYLKRLRAGMVNPTPRLQVQGRMPFSAIVDGDNGSGPVVAVAAMRACLERAEAIGIGCATARRSNHFGAASIFALPAVEKGCIALVMSPGSKSLAPYGSREPLLGTNPLAMAVPAGRYAPWVLDMAASVAARGYIRLAASRGQPIPEGWALDADGTPTTDAERALRGVMLPFAGAKGSGLAMMVDILAGVLAGAGFGGDVPDWNLDFERPADVGHFFLAMKVEAFMPLVEFEARMETAIARLKALKPAKGFDEVLYPGEKRARIENQRMKAGIPLEPKLASALGALAAEQGLDLPDPIPTPAKALRPTSG